MAEDEACVEENLDTYEEIKAHFRRRDADWALDSGKSFLWGRCVIAFDLIWSLHLSMNFPTTDGDDNDDEINYEDGEEAAEAAQPPRYFQKIAMHEISCILICYSTLQK